MERDNVHYITLKTMLESLSKSRIEKGAWRDAEAESGGTQVFKIAESLRPFYLFALNEPQQPLLIRPEILKEDTEFVFKTVQKNGFFPSPYSGINSKDQYMDFAAFMLDFSSLFYRLATIKKTAASNWRLSSSAKEIARKAFDFLCEPAHRMEDEKYARWGGTTRPSRPGKAGSTEYFTDIYFTAIVMISLEKALGSPALTLKEKEKDNVKLLIQKAGAWIVDQRNESYLLKGDEKRATRIYTTWGLRALADTYDLQESIVRKITKVIIPAYLNDIDDTIKKGPISITQDYLQVLSPESNSVLSYEDRSSWAGVLLTLISLSTVNDFQTLLEESSYLRIQDSVINGLMALRDTVSDLWYKEFPILSIHSYITEALLNLLQGKQILRYSFEVTAALVSRTLKETIDDPRIIKSLQQVFYEKLERNARMKEQGDQINEEFNNLKNEGKGRKQK